MRIVRYGKDEVPFDANTAITVGTFDGVHLGHQGIIGLMRNVANQESELGAKSEQHISMRTVVVTFDPHPQIVLHKAGKEDVRLLSTVEERCEMFEKLGVDVTIIITFTKEFSATPAETFIRDVVVNTIGVKHFFLGHDHMFGKDRSGNEELLKKMGAEFGFTVEQIPPLETDGVVVSSTKIRNALKDGDVEGAARMFGRPYSITGTVVEGDGRGRALGIPTANIQPTNEFKLLPGNGVYVVSAVIDGTVEIGMANIGVRPTFTSGERKTLEVHFLDVDADLYRRDVTIAFHRFLRNEQKFESKEAFLEQLEKDRQQTQSFKHTFFLRS